MQTLMSRYQGLMNYPAWRDLRLSIEGVELEPKKTVREVALKRNGEQEIVGINHYGKQARLARKAAKAANADNADASDCSDTDEDR